MSLSLAPLKAITSPSFTVEQITVPSDLFSATCHSSWPPLDSNTCLLSEMRYNGGRYCSRGMEIGLFGGA